MTLYPHAKNPKNRSFRAARTVNVAAVIVATVAGLLMAAASSATALPRMSLTAGSPCATCHVAPQGGGMRNFIGFGTSQHTGAIGWSKVGIDRFDNGSPSWAGDKVTVGLDMRSVIARLGRPTGTKDKAELPPFLYIPMQFQPYIGVKPIQWLDIVGSFNAATVGPLGRSFPGQPSYEVAAQVHGPAHLPTVRVGMIQPTFGIRHDDHSMLMRADASNPRRPFIAPNYADWGGEVGYQPKPWFRLDAGGYLASNLSAAMAGTVKSGDVAYNARVMFMPQVLFGGTGADSTDKEDGFSDDDDDDFGEDDEEDTSSPMAGSLNTWIGASLFGAGDFQMINAFAGVGVSNVGALMLEAAMVQRGDNFTALNLMAMASIRCGVEWLQFNLRGEMATAKNDADVREWTTTQIVAGFEIFVLPYVELRPEYRILRTDEYAMNHYTLQFHTAF